MSRQQLYDVIVSIKNRPHGTARIEIDSYRYSSIPGSSPRVAISRALLMAGKEFGEKNVVGARVQP